MKKLLVVGSNEPPKACPIDCVKNCVELFTDEGFEVWASLKPEDVLKCDGLIVPGGLPDISPSYWGEKNIACNVVDEELDRLQMAVLDEGVKQKKPILGFCRGFQLINVYFGGSMIQDISCKEYHRFQPENLVHDTQCIQGTFLHELYGDSIVTNSMHHQALLKIPDCIGISQVWIDDKYDKNIIFDELKSGKRTHGSNECIVEGIYHKELPIIGVQWHPEEMPSTEGHTAADPRKIYNYFYRLLESRN